MARSYLRTRWHEKRDNAIVWVLLTVAVVGSLAAATAVLAVGYALRK